MAIRDFSDSVKLFVITENLKKNNGEICCDICGTKLESINECHFDHVFPFSKGGRSTADNCQILCISCNLKKNDKELEDFLLEEKAKQFLTGDSTTQTQETASKTANVNEIRTRGKLSKSEFDLIIASFIAKKGDIRKVDFGREYNNLPSFHYVTYYYGGLLELKKAFGLEDLSSSWNRETIKSALESFVKQNGDLLQKDLTKKNKLPSLPCILSYFPEYKSFTDVKKNLLHLNVRQTWTLESTIQAGKDYMKRHRVITLSSLRTENGLPTSKVIYTLFGSLSAFQEAVGSAVTTRNTFVSEEEIELAVNTYFGDDERTVDSMKEFFTSFPYSQSTIHKRFGSFSRFCDKYGITVNNSKKAKYTKLEVDDAISRWVKEGKEIPRSKDLSKLGLPSTSVILRYYEDWREPFILYRKLYDKLN